MLALDIAFKLALVVVVCVFAGMAWGAWHERGKYLKANAKLGELIARHELRAKAVDESGHAAVVVLEPWLRHDANCGWHFKKPCLCGLDDAVKTLDTVAQSELVFPGSDDAAPAR